MLNLTYNYYDIHRICIVRGGSTSFGGRAALTGRPTLSKYRGRRWNLTIRFMIWRIVFYGMAKMGSFDRQRQRCKKTQFRVN